MVLQRESLRDGKNARRCNLNGLKGRGFEYIDE
jgi:hypothetical protein